MTNVLILTDFFSLSENRLIKSGETLSVENSLIKDGKIPSLDNKGIKYEIQKEAPKSRKTIKKTEE